MAGLFGGLFDFNHDGKMSGFERTMEFMAFEKMMEDNSTEDDTDTLFSDELESVELNHDDLKYMDEDAGLDLDDLDF